MSDLDKTLLSIFQPRQNYGPATQAIVLPATAATQNQRVVYTYLELQRLAESLQAQIASFGLQPGEVVSSSLVNGIEFTVAFIATGAER